MEEKGIVIERKNGSVVVEVERKEACGRCGMCRMGPAGKGVIEAFDDLDARVGDTVVIEMESRDVLVACFVAYVAPVISMFLGFFLGSFLADALGLIRFRDGLAALAGFLFLGASYVCLRLYDRRARRVLRARVRDILR